jgi:tmRNA-binding protein
VPREQGRKLIAQNKKARYDYHIDDTWEAGLVLMGTEVKSLRMGRASLVDGYAQVRDGELWLMNVHQPLGSPEPQAAPAQEGDPADHRKDQGVGIDVDPALLVFQ